MLIASKATARNKNYSFLDATDGSSELAAIASRRIGQPVRTMLVNEFDAIGIYDVVYACAALTHAPRTDLRGVVEKIY